MHVGHATLPHVDGESVASFAADRVGSCRAGVPLDRDVLDSPKMNALIHGDPSLGKSLCDRDVPSLVVPGHVGDRRLAHDFHRSCGNVPVRLDHGLREPVGLAFLGQVPACLARKQPGPFGRCPVS